MQFVIWSVRIVTQLNTWKFVPILEALSTWKYSIFYVLIILGCELCPGSRLVDTASGTYSEQLEHIWLA